MKKIDDSIPTLGIHVILLLMMVFGIILQLTGYWIMMLIVGLIGGLLIKNHYHAFIIGFVAAFISWLVLYVYVLITAQALIIADFFISLLGLAGLGWLVILIGCLIGGVLGGFGAVLGRSIVEFIDEFLMKPEIE